MPAREERTRSPSTSPQNSPASSAVPVSQMPDLSASPRARLQMRATTERALFLTTSSRRSEGSPALSVLPPSKRPGFPASPRPALDARFAALLASLRPSGICPPRHPWYAPDRTEELPLAAPPPAASFPVLSIAFLPAAPAAPKQVTEKAGRDGSYTHCAVMCGCMCMCCGVHCCLFHWFLGKLFLVEVHPYMTSFCTFWQSASKCRAM